MSSKAAYILCWRSWYIKSVSSEMKILTGCLICSLTDFNRVKMKVVVMFIVMSMRTNKLKLMILVSLVFWKPLEPRVGSGFFFFKCNIQTVCCYF